MIATISWHNLCSKESSFSEELEYLAAAVMYLSHYIELTAEYKD